MKVQHDSSMDDWRRRAQNGSGDIAVAVVLTVLAAGLLGFAWVGGSRHMAPGVGHSASFEQRGD